MTLKLKSIPKDEIHNYFVCSECKELIHFCDSLPTVAWRDDPNGILASCRSCQDIKQKQHHLERCEKRIQQIKEVLGDQESDEDDLVTVDNTLNEMSESSESGESCECETEVSDETCESDESNESEVSENNNKDDVITCEKSQKMTTKENDKTIMKKLKLEFWISL